ncbi:MAG: DNA polymerase III subunit chi [Alphaproteobacteria bacterium]
MKNHNLQLSVNLYYIKSNFIDIALRLCNKLIEKEKKLFINLNDEEEMDQLDKNLWTRDRDSFLPHKILGEKIHTKDKIILFYGNYEKMKEFENNQIILISPTVKIKKLYLFKNFFLFSHNSIDKKKYLSIFQKLAKNGRNIKCFYEYDIFKWKLIPN